MNAAPWWLAATALLWLAVIVAALVEQVRYERRTGPKCPCGRSPGGHTEPLLGRIPRQLRRLP